MAKQNPKRNHHILPELYLKGFVINPGEPFIWVYKKGAEYKPGRGKLTNNPFKDSIGRQTVRDFYAYPIGQGSRDFETYENLLEKLEKPADRIFKKLRSFNPITANDKQTFCLYLAQMLKRVPAYREKLGSIAAKIAADYELPDEAIRRFNWPDTEGTRKKAKSIAWRISQQKEFPTQTHLKTLYSITSSPIIDVLAQMSWRYFTAPYDHLFLTGDNPVFFTKRIGLNKLDSEVSFPISRSVCLVASNRRYAETFTEASTQIVKELNRRTASSASSYLYSPQCEEWIVSLLNKEQHILHKIY